MEQPERTITLVLADDHNVMRSGLRLLLDAEPDFEVLAEAADVPGAWAVSRYCFAVQSSSLAVNESGFRVCARIA
jgi:DNA-binding NarL/FixJ family response regulator